MIYYNQYNYPNSPYPSPENPNATIASSGCGVCSGAMIISNMIGTVIDPVAMATYSIAHGARVSGGTDMNILAAAICNDYGLTYQATADISKLIAHLQAGNLAIANVSGDQVGYFGVFSSSGHFIVPATMKDDSSIGIMDPGYYDGKFNIVGRTGKVTVDGDLCYCSPDTLAADVIGHDPSYWLFTEVKKLDNTPDAYAKDAIEWALENGILVGGSDGDLKLHSQITRQDMLVFLYRAIVKKG